jgi:hypothetical protein
VQSIRFLIKVGALFCWLIISSTSYASAALDCRRTLEVATPQILTQETLKIMAWNMKNVSMHQGKFERQGLNEMKRVEGNVGQPRAKPEWEIQAARDIVASERPDFGVFTEIENVHALRQLLEEDPRLRDTYHILLKEGNDARGIDIATVVRKDLGLRYKLDSHKDLEWTDRFQVGKNWKEETGPVFSRDLPAVRMYRPGEETPFLILIGNHGKSKRDREGDPESRRWRTIQYDKAAEIIQNYKKLYPAAIVIMAGDFNTDVRNGFEMRALHKITQSAFDLVPRDQQIPIKERVTHSYFPKGGGPRYSMIDDVRIWGDVDVLDASIYQFLDKNGNPIGLPKTFKQRETLQPSDHNPVIAIIKNKI